MSSSSCAQAGSQLAASLQKGTSAGTSGSGSGAPVVVVVEVVLVVELLVPVEASAPVVMSPLVEVVGSTPLDPVAETLTPAVEVDSSWPVVLEELVWAGPVGSEVWSDPAEPVWFETATSRPT